MKKALIIIDMQNDYFEGGRSALVGIDKALENTNKLIASARANGNPVYFIQHIASLDASFFAEGTKGAELYSELDIQDETPITKRYPNSFRSTKLQEELESKDISDLIICGAMTHMCIDTTARAGYDLGYTITLAQDACATKDLTYDGRTIEARDVHHAFLAALDGTFCDIVDTKDIL